MALVRHLESGKEKSEMRQKLWERLDLGQRRACLAVSTEDTEALSTLMDMLRTWSSRDRHVESERVEEEAKQRSGFLDLALRPVLEGGELKGWELGMRRHVLLDANLPTQLSARGRTQLSKGVLTSANSVQGMAVRVRQEVARDSAAPAGARRSRTQIVAALFLALELKWVAAADALLSQETPQRSGRRKKTLGRRARTGTRTPQPGASLLGTGEEGATRPREKLVDEESRTMPVAEEAPPEPVGAETHEEAQAEGGSGQSPSTPSLPSTDPLGHHLESSSADSPARSRLALDGTLPLGPMNELEEHLTIARTFVHVTFPSQHCGCARAASLPARRRGSACTVEEAPVCRCGRFLYHPGWTQCQRGRGPCAAPSDDARAVAVVEPRP